MIIDRPFRKSRGNERHFGIPNPHSQFRADGLLRFRWEFTKNILLNMGMSTEYEIVSSHTRPVHCISLEKNDHQYLLSGGLDGLVALYDLNGAVNDRKISNRRALKSISIASNSVRGKAIVPGGGPPLSVAVSSISWYPKDSGLFAVSDFDGNVNIWDTNAFSIVGNFKLRSKIFNTKFNSDGSLIALALDDNSIRLCDPSCGDCTHVLSGHSSGVTCVEWSPIDEFILASASWDGKMKLWDTRKGSYGAALLSFDWQQDHTARPECYLQETPDIRYSSNQSRNVGLGPGQYTADISSSERQALLNSDRNRVKKFDWKNDDVAKAHESSGVTSILYSPCGRFIVSSGNDKKVRLWSSNNGYLHAVNYDISSSSNLPFSMAMISDFECGGDDVLAYPDGEKGEIALVALHSSTGKPFNRLKGHFGAVTSLAYRRGYGQLISAARDGMIHVWDSSLAEVEKESSRSDDVYSKLERKSGSNVVKCNNDDWSDSGDSEGDKGETEGQPRPSVPRRSFVPPIVQRYLDDAAESARLLLLDRERARERAARSRIQSSSSEVSHSTSSAYEGIARESVGKGAGMVTGVATGSAQSRKLIVTKPKRNEKGREMVKEKSYRERAEIVFALQTAAALRGGVYDPSTSSSCSFASSSSSSSSSSSRSIAAPVSSIGPLAAPSPILTSSVGTVAVDPPHAPSAGDSGVVLSLRQREKEKEAEGQKVKKSKSALSNLRNKYGAGTAHKKSRR